MRTTPFRQIFNQTARWMGFNPNKEIEPDEREAIVDRINDRVRAIWSGWPWPEWNVTEQRAFRQIWNVAHHYSQNDGDPDEVFHIPTVLYYQVRTDVTGDPPIGTPPTDENWWTVMDSADVGTYIAYDQTCRRSIGQVSGVFQSNPSGCNSCNGSAGALRFHPSENGIEICSPGGPTVFIQYKMPVPTYSMVPYAEGRTYNRADTVFEPSTGECFQALFTTINPPNTTDWTRMPFLEAWGGFVVSGAYADALNELDRTGNAETQLLELKAVRAERRATDALEDEVAALRAQGQMLEWSVCKRNGYWCESLPFSGGDVSELTDECENGIVFPIFGPPSPAPPGIGGCPTPDVCPDIAYLPAPNVFRNVNTLPGIRFESREVNTDYPLSVIDFAALVDASGADRTVYLPLAVGSGQVYYVQKRDDSTNQVIIFPQPGDEINGDPTFTLLDQYADLTVLDGALGEWVKVGAGIGDIGVDTSDFALKSQPNIFTDLNSLTGVRFSTGVVTDDYVLTPTDFAVLADATTGPVNIQLPPATGSGQLYYLEKTDNTTGVVSINRSGSDLIAGSVSISFVDQYANASLLDSAPGYWSNLEAPPVATTNTALTNVGWWYRPEITNDADLKTWPTIGQPLNSRIDVLYPDGLRIYVLYYGPADVTDPRQVAPNDYNVSFNNVRWIQKL